MRFFIDTANLNEIREAASLGILDGVTTNPSLIAKEGKPFKATILEICNLVDGPVSVEVVATDSGGMCNEAHEFAGWHKNVVVKLPTTREGLKACKCLTADGIKTNLTLCFSANQALLVAHQPHRDGPDQADRADLQELRLPDAGTSGVPAASVARRGSGAGGGACGDAAVQGAGHDVQTSADRPRAGAVSEGLGEGTEVSAASQATHAGS
jgi:hypothetical protein